jgi:hypothetical protein
MAQAKYEGKRVEVELITDTYKIRGTLFVPLAGEGGYRSRLSDLLNKSEVQFPALTGVKAEALPDPSEKWEAPFIAVNTNTITMVRAIKE